MEINGKIYRNLEGQVGYLTDKYGDLQDQINDLKGKVVHYIVVATLPTEDIDTSAVYLVGPKGTAPVTYYEEWVYVEISEGVWSWEKLGDTASIDLSGYLEKVETTTVLPQVYIKNADGTQGMFNIVKDGYDANSIVRRTGGGQVVCNAPEGNNDAINLNYANSNFVAKDTTTTPYAKAYIKKTDGTQDTVSMTSSDPTQGFIAQWGAGGRMATKDPVNSSDAVNKSYADSNYVGKQTGTTSFRQTYAKGTDGSQYMQVINGKDMDAGVDCIAAYGTDGRLRVGEPVNAKDAATKGYVDAAVGQLIYKHAITLNFTVSSKSFTLTLVVLNGTSTAYTSTEGRQLLTVIKASAYSIITDSWVDSKFWTVAVTASDKYIHDDTGIGFLLMAPVDGTTIYVDGIDPNYNANITNVSISDVVTTW